jgi:hypothetical protein
VEYLQEDCSTIGWVEDVPDVRNSSRWTSEEFDNLSSELQAMFRYRYRDDFDLWGWANAD